MEHDATIDGGSGATVAWMNPLTGGIDLPDKVAAHRFANIPELVIMMGDHSPKKDLPSLCLVNSDFNAIFSPRLYRHIRLNASFLLPKYLAWVAGNRRFRHTKTLSFRNSGGFPQGQPLSEEICTLVQRTATDVLRHSPTLHTIILDSTFLGSEKAVLVINNGLDGRFKRSSTNLQSLTLTFNATPCRELSPSIFQQHSLKSLHLSNIPTASWRVEFLCQILKDSPELRYLKLSYLKGAANQWTLEEICKRYNQLGALPLKLEVVMLGWGVDLSMPSQVLPFATGAARLETQVLNFFAMRKTRDLMRRVHLEVEGTLFKKYDEFKDMTRKLFCLYDLSDPTSRLAPMGFSFRSKLSSEVNYQRSIALPLPNTRYLDITIHYKHLVGVSGIGLSKMSALECLSLSVYVYQISEWDESHIVGEKQLKALGKAAKSCPDLRYVRMKMGATGPVHASIAGLSCSWEIFRERRPRFKQPQPVFKVRDVRADKLLRPQSMWTVTEKRAQYVKEDRDKLGYDPPLWME